MKYAVVVTHYKKHLRAKNLRKDTNMEISNKMLKLVKTL